MVADAPGRRLPRPRAPVALRDPHDKLPIGTLDGLEAFDPGGLDEGIRHYVLILLSQGIDTCQSCEGGPGHSYLEPTVEFLGAKSEGPRAVAAALAYGLPVTELCRVWDVRDGEITGPTWRMTFNIKADAHVKAVAAREASWFERKKTGRASA